MGNQESIDVEKLSSNLALDFDHSSMTYLYHVEHANLVKCQLSNESSSNNDNHQGHSNASPLFFL